MELANDGKAIAAMLPVVLRYFGSPSVTFRVRALTVMQRFLAAMPPALFENVHLA